MTYPYDVPVKVHVCSRIGGTVTTKYTELDYSPILWIQTLKCLREFEVGRSYRIYCWRVMVGKFYSIVLMTSAATSQVIQSYVGYNAVYPRNEHLRFVNQSVVSEDAEPDCLL